MWKLRVYVIIVVCLLMGTTAATARQTGQPAITILRAVPAPSSGSGGLPLDVFFTLRGPDNRPLKGVQFDQVEVTIDGQTVRAQRVEPATSPIKIALLLDASGSMVPFMPDVQTAAATAVGRATNNTGFAVFKFSDVPADQPFVPLSSGFNNDTSLVVSDIRNVKAVNNGPTCLYNATYKALEYVSAAVAVNPSDRPALIVFTDGKDERAQDKLPCSTRTFDEVLALARRDQLIPIHTIGFCTNERCENIDRTTLERLAQGTGGFSVAGKQSDLDQLFNDIIDGLSSQWVARVEVFPEQGQRTGALTVSVGGVGTPLSAGFVFTADRDYANPPTFGLELRYEESRDHYIARLRLEHPEAVKTVISRVLDQKRGVYIEGADAQHPASALSEPFEIATTGLEAGREYCFQIEAIGRNDEPLKNDEGGRTLAETCGLYEPALAFNIISYETDYEQNELRINFAIQGAGGQVLQMQGDIIDSESGEPVGKVPLTVLEAGQSQVVIPVPQRLAELAGGRPFAVNLLLIPPDGRSVMPTSAPPYEPAAPERPSFWQRLGTGVANPIVLVAIAVIVVVAGAAFWLLRKPRSTIQTIPDPSGPYNYTQALSLDQLAAAEKAARARKRTSERPARPATMPSALVQVVSTVDQQQTGFEEITRFPCVIGRKKDAVDMYIGGDENVSRKHLKIDLKDGELYLTDLSANGTTINGMPLASGVQICITEKTEVGLSPRTVLRIEPRTKRH